MIHRSLTLGLLVGVSSCTVILGRYDDSGTATGSAASGSTTASASSGGGGAATSSSGTGGATSSASVASSASGTGAATSSSTGAGGTCTNPATDCPVPSTKCVIASCDAGHHCATAPASPGSPCSDAGGAVCTGAGACVQCVGDANCSGATPACDAFNQCVPCTATNTTACVGAKPACNTATQLCAQCSATNSTQCTGATPTCFVANGVCGSCASSADCAGDLCVSGKCYAHGDYVGGLGEGIPDCSGDLVLFGNSACTTVYPGTHWCTAADVNGTGTYHAMVCAAGSGYQFSGDVTCSANSWSADKTTACNGGVVSYTPQFFASGGSHEMDCCY